MEKTYAHEKYTRQLRRVAIEIDTFSTEVRIIQRGHRAGRFSPEEAARRIAVLYREHATLLPGELRRLEAYAEEVVAFGREDTSVAREYAS